MLQYIIDGFNIIHRISSLKNSAFPQASLINYIRQNKLTGSKNNKVIIVFDGKRVPLAESDFEILFSEASCADEVINEKVQKAKNKRQIVVVSDDHQIRDFVKKEGAQVCKLADFVKTKKKKVGDGNKEISYTLQREITEELRKIWLKNNLTPDT